MADLDIAAFLRARLDEAFAAADSSPDVGRYDEVELQAKFDMPGYHAEYYASVPASLRRAEITAKRQILERCTTNVEYEGEPVADDVLRLLALPYVGHPEFREEWKP